MKVLINIYNLTSGGGFTIGFGLVEELYLINSTDNYIVIIPSKKLYPFDNNNNNNNKITFVELSWFYKSKIGKLFVERKIARIAQKNAVSKIVSLTNYAIPTQIPQTLLIHWPYLVYTEKELWDNMPFFNKIKRRISRYKIKRNLKFAKTIVVQTDIMKLKLSKFVNGNKIKIIPAFHNITSKEVGFKPKEIKKLAFVSNFYEHKNHEILIPLAKEMRRRNSDFQIFITIDKNLSFAKKLLPFKKYIINLGKLSPSELEQIYPSFDGLFLPTLVETFGIPYIEAMHFGLPIFTSDRDFAHSVCGEYATYFDSKNASNILDVLEKNKVSKSISKPYFPTRKEVVKQLLAYTNLTFNAV